MFVTFIRNKVPDSEREPVEPEPGAGGGVSRRRLGHRVRCLLRRAGSPGVLPVNGLHRRGSKSNKKNLLKDCLHGTIAIAIYLSSMTVTDPGFPRCESSNLEFRAKPYYFAGFLLAAAWR